MAKEKENGMANVGEEKKAEVSGKGMIGGFDLDDIVKRAQSLYGKDKAGAMQIGTGKSLVRPVGDKDFILWRKNNFWQELTGLKGIPFSKFVQVSGKMDSGKSSLAGQFMVEAQEQGYFVILWDSEQKFSPERYDNHLGGDSSKLLVVDTNSIIDGVGAITNLVRIIKEKSEEAKIFIVWDSIGASLNKTENDDEINDMSKQPGIAAKENGWACKRFGKLINNYQNRATGEHTIAILAVNQVYSQLMTPGLKEKGGEALQYFSSIIVQLTRKRDLNKVKGGKKIKFGILTRARVKKNHLFSGTENVAELDVVVSADGLSLPDEIKKKDVEVQGWDDADNDSE